jgi:fructan beta-fructosidase
VDNLVLSNTQAVGWANQTGANLLVNGKVVRSATGNASAGLDWTDWNVSDL